MSNSVPATTKTAMTTTYVCMTAGDTDAEGSANGLLVNMLPPDELGFNARARRRRTNTVFGTSGRVRAYSVALGDISCWTAASRGSASIGVRPLGVGAYRRASN